MGEELEIEVSVIWRFRIFTLAIASLRFGTLKILTE